MNNKIKNGIALSIIPQIVVVKLLSNYPHFIETYYSTGLYPFLSQLLRALLGWIPFSVGDLGYTLLAVIAIRFVIVYRGTLFKSPLQFLRNVSYILSITYFSFHLLWGLNYYREPLASKLNLQLDTAPDELTAFVERLIKKTNEIHQDITLDSTAPIKIPYTKAEQFKLTQKGYGVLEKQFPFLAYERPSIKKSVYSTALTYMGYGGYLNPFTNEAQVNALLPNFRFPVVSAHEIGHQVGYSAENETNFIGYLATLANDDHYFRYAAYTYALSYCLSDLKRQDEEAFEQLYGQLNVGVKKNFQEMTAFWQAYENPMEPVFKSVFNTFLKANNQPAGIQSYNQIVALLVAYHQKNPL